MIKSLGTRLYRTIFLVSLVTILLSLGAIEFFYEDMEDTILDLELTQEQDYFRNHIQGDGFQTWKTARLNAIFLPEGQPESLLPEYLKGRPTPDSSEIETGDETFLVLVEAISQPPGRLYLSQDISIMESQETLSQITLISIFLGMSLIGFVLARLSTRQLVDPLKRLTHQIQATEPDKSMQRLAIDYKDIEFINIASAFNRFLDALEAFVDREKSFVKLASHELRTPLAVITGALDIIEKRDQLSGADRLTLGRIRRATSDMHADVEVLLKLARGESEQGHRVKISLLRSIRDTIADLESTHADHAGRFIVAEDASDQTLHTDPALLRMLIRNLLQNALKHTRGEIRIALLNNGMSVSDDGQGLPDPVIKRLQRPLPTPSLTVKENSFGLLIVQLICERLGWHLTIPRSDDSGTDLHIRFSSPKPSYDTENPD
ncbi:HAMP domain-containing sensor histidine kinase [Marinobacter sp. BGYM27]|uniref:sensor histidine kinase n=1 Tax=Marinobacter sp. BGYM27 TaxID=2975597 RepID=UPI0021A3429D|nr:HAMP domain-containing sensor histidine kinase [Marinobacter sp. BGYM27]MDG5500938.1 HAMP domain-containing sensor histidine kinase [Marinobacter sp. BGYM27]